jgi:hypothetical protein
MKRYPGRPTPSYRGKSRAAKPFPAKLRLIMVQDAIHHLKLARHFLAQADAPCALGKVRAALKSAEGAERHASLAPYREARQAKAKLAKVDPLAFQRANIKGD